MELPNKDDIHHSSPHVLQGRSNSRRSSNASVGSPKGAKTPWGWGFFEVKFVDEPLNTGKTHGSIRFGQNVSFFLTDAAWILDGLLVEFK